MNRMKLLNKHTNRDKPHPYNYRCNPPYCTHPTLDFEYIMNTQITTIPGSIVVNYMIMSGIGFVLLFVSNQAVVFVDEPYPPFGFASVSFMGLSSYLVLVGIYSSAISISEDSRLRSSIRNYAMKEANLLDSIGMAHMEQEIEKKVITLTKQNQDRLAEETGIQSSLTEDDVKSYLQEVIKEIQHSRNPY